MKKNIAIYTRSNSQEKLEESVLKINHILEKNDYLNDDYNIAYYEDIGYSGTNDDRPGLASLITSMKNNEIDILITPNIETLSRNFLFLDLELYPVLLDFNVDLITYNGKEDINTKMSLNEILDDEITKEVEDLFIIDKNRRIKNGDIVEISLCNIINDVGSSTMIKTKDYVDKMDIMNLAVSQSDGTSEETTIHTDYTFVDSPIEVEVISGAYDYETGYHYKAKVVDEKLLDEFKKIGTTGYTPEHYKKYENEFLYDDAKKAAENFDPSIVYFSEFDIIKRLEKDSNLDGGM